MGSTGLYLTPVEAAEVLGVSVSMVRVYDRRQLLDGHYPEGKKAGKRYLADDVYVLNELRTEHHGDFLKRLPQIAMRAAAASRRCERKLDEIMIFLGVNDVVLDLSEDRIRALHEEVEFLFVNPEAINSKELLIWAKRLLAINEEYLELVKAAVGGEFPWKAYMDFAKILCAHTSGRDRSFTDHARSNLRNVAYFYERGTRGVDAANKAFPGERFSGKILQRLLMT